MYRELLEFLRNEEFFIEAEAKPSRMRSFVDNYNNAYGRWYGSLWLHHTNRHHRWHRRTTLRTLHRNWSSVPEAACGNSPHTPAKHSWPDDDPTEKDRQQT